MNGELNYSVATSAVFSVLLIFFLFTFLGISAQSIILSILILPLTNSFFLKWNSKSFSGALTNVVIRSFLFVVAIYFLYILKIKIFSGGQLGSGDRLQYSGRTITPLGYWTLLKFAGFLGLLVFPSAIVASSIAVMISKIRKMK